MTAGAFFAFLAVVAISLKMTWTGLMAVALVLYAAGCGWCLGGPGEEFSGLRSTRRGRSAPVSLAAVPP
jgi:hypothetical protein